MNFIEKKDKNIDSLYKALCEQFPKSELKKESSFKNICKNPSYKIFDIFHDKKLCGHTSIFELPDKSILVDYFFIYESMHSCGLGTKAFEHFKLKTDYIGCYLEVEKENEADLKTIRRARFYKKLGARKMNLNYLYPNEDGFLPMDLYFMPFRQNCIPAIESVYNNIKIIFENLHYELHHFKEVYKKIIS